MRKSTLLFIIATFIFNVTVDAQIKKGSLFLGGDIGAAIQKVKRDGVSINTQKGFSIAPVFGKAIKENLIVGIDAGFGWSQNNNNLGTYQDSKSNFYNAGVFIRKYKEIGKSNFSMFLQGRFGMDYGISEYKNPAPSFEKTERYTIGVSAYPGISYTVSKRLQLEASFNNFFNINYFAEKREYGGAFPYKDKANGIDISTSLDNLGSLQLGFRLLINKK